MSSADTAGRDERQQQPQRRPGPNPLSWILLGMLLGLIVIVLLLYLYPQWWRQAPPKTVVTVTLPDEFRDAHRARLKSLETEQDRLLALLQKDPCDLAELLGLSPRQMQPGPAHGDQKAPPTGGGAAQKPPIAPGNGMFSGSAPSGDGTPSGNGTIPKRPESAPGAALPDRVLPSFLQKWLSRHGDGVR